VVLFHVFTFSWFVVFLVHDMVLSCFVQFAV
jgi:hypothetical protein